MLVTARSGLDGSGYVSAIAARRFAIEAGEARRELTAAKGKADDYEGCAHNLGNKWQVSVWS